MIRRTVVALAALAASLCAAPALHAASFVVSTNADTGAGSLRAAIDASNTNPGIDTISFDLQFAESTITPATSLPLIADPANIDGTIPGPVNGTQHVRLDGSALGTTGVGLDFHSGAAAQSVVRGLAITSFGQVGVQLGVDNVLVAGNLIGTDASGETGLGNGTGIASDGPSQIGGTNKGDGNVISGNLIAGIRLDPGASSRIVGNFIGTKSDGVTPLGNTGPGILVDQGAADANKIGGTDAGEGNVIAFNETGVLVQGSGFGDTIRGNSIFSNGAAGGIGIDLAPAGVTQNDPGDTDTGPNDLQNFPDVTGAFALAGGTVEVTGTVTGSRPAGSLYAVDFFAGASCNPSENGEGERYLGSVSVPEGAFDTKAALPGTASAGEIVTATATDDLGDTSEFSQCTQVAASAGRTFVVNTPADHDDGTCDVEDCSLREAIEAADANPGPDAISFDIAPGGLQTIQLQAALGQLPFVTGPVAIDGTTQPGTGPGPGIEVDGEQLEEANGLQVTSGGSTIRGLVLNRFSSSAIVLQGVGGNVVSGNYIGTNATGTSDAANGTGIEISQSPDNLIGGSTAADGNVISGNVVGITISNGPSTGNRVQGNIIGLDAGGTQALATFADPMDTGILVNGGAGSTTIGGTSPGEGNVISGQGQDAIELDTTQDNVVEGNFIGTDKTGTSLPGGLAVAQDTGVAIQNTSSHNFIGGPSAGANVIAGQTGDVGVQVDGESTNNTVVGNFIGTDPGGTQNLANAGGVRILNTSETNTVANNTIRFSTDDGVQIDSGPNTIVGNTITDGAQAGIRVVGGTTTAIGVPGTGNVLTSNAFGIVLGGSSSSTKVLGNRIGTDAGGTLDRGNADSGILVVGSNDNQIGGTAEGEGNTVAFNGIDGVEVDSGTGNAIRGNSIFSNKGEPNDGLGIDLDAGSASGPFGVNPNDPGDPDTGPNELQNYPVLSDVSSGGEGGTTIDGTLNSVGGTTYHLDFYSSPACDPSGNGEGRTYIGSQDVLTNAAGDAPFTAAFPVVDVSGGNAVTATATDPSGNTSEFSACATVAASGGALTGSVSVDPPANAFDLTAIGTIDWAVWGFASGGTSTSLAPDVRKATVAAPAISDLTNIDPAPSVVLRGLGQFTSAAPFFFDWSDGTSPAVAESATGGIQHDGQQQALSTLNHGFAFDVPADTTSRTLTVFVATNRADGQLTATLSDGSAPPFVDTLPHATDARSGVYTITYAAGSPGQTLHVEWVESLDNCAAFHCDNAAIDAVALAPASPPPILANVTLTAPDTTTAGAGKVKLADVPPSALLQPQSSAESTPVNETPVNETPVNETPVNELPVNELPVNEIPVNETSIHGLGLNFASLSQSIPALGDITLNTIPLLRPGGWTAALAETPLAALALQNVTLRDYYALPADENPETRPTDPIPRITLGDLDLTRSPLGGLPASSIVLANVPLSDMRSLAAWCDLFGPVYCPTPPGSTQLAGQSVFAAALQGAPVNETPVNETPVNETPVNEIPVNEVPVNETPVNEVPVNELPVNETPVNETNLAGTPVNELPVNEISPRSSPVNETTLDELPVNEIVAANSTGSPVYEIPVNELETRNDVIVCAVGTPGPGTVDCSTATLGDAFAANAIRPGVTLGDLLAADGGPPDALAGIKVGDLHYFGTATDPVTFRALVDSFPDGTITLGDYFLLVLRSPTAQQGLAWEHLDLAGSNLPAHATDAPKMLYQASFDVGAGPLGANGLAPTEVDVNLPAGFDYVPGSSEIVQKPGTCDSAVALADPSRATPGKLSWTVPAVVGEGYVICFDARPGITLGPRATGLDATTTGGATGSALTSTAVGDTFEPNDSPATATPITTDEFLLSYLTSSDDVDYYTFDPGNNIAAGSRVTVHLSHLPADYDLVVYGPSTPPLSPSDGTGVPLDGEPLTDDVPRFTHSTDVLPSQSLDDLNLQPGLPMVGVSASRGNDPEDVVFTYDGSGPYTIQITGYNGATSGDPYMLRVQTAPPLTASTVPGFPSGTTQGPELGTLPTGLNTVFVVNQEQLSGQYGETAAQNVTDAVKNHLGDMATLGFPSAILSVDRITDVEAKYAAWDANPGDPTLANAVVRSINVAIDQQIRQQPGGAGLKYIVLVGGDRVIPFARLSDFTAAANETGYASMFDQNTDLFSSLALGNFLSDDPYGDLNPVPYLTRQLYIPELAVGRLVETPNQIIGAIARFAGSNGQLVPQTSLTTGYDFLTDGATRVKTAFDNRLGSGSVGLISDTWDRTQLLQDLGLVPATAAGMPSLVSINGHADHYRLQPPGGATGTAPAPLFTTTDLAGSSAPRINRIVFGMGCHAGLSVPDSIVTADPSVSTLDWPEAYMGWQTGTGADPDANAQQFGVGAYLGNTGYGYGDTVTVAYSEEINQLFAQRIAGGSSVGDALTDAKQAYFGGRGVFGVYDEKAMGEFTLYGMPMWSVSAAPHAPAPAPAPKSAHAARAAAATASNPLVTDPSTGLEAETFDVDPVQNTPQPNATNTKYWSGADGVQVSQYRPIEPKTYVPLDGTTVHGALITALSSEDHGNFDPVYARPTVDLSTNEPELSFGDVAFPSRIQAVRTFQTSDGGRAQRVVLVTGQFFRDSTTSAPDAKGTGVQRLFTRIAGRAFRSASTDYFPPAFRLIQAVQAGSSAAFTVKVSDLTPTGDGTVKRVLVGVRSGDDSDWTFADLVHAAATTRWTGTVPISGTGFEFFAQAVDASGNVAVSTNKGFYFKATPPATGTGGVIVKTTADTPPSGWFDGSADVEVTVNDAAPLPGEVTVSVDGGEPQPYAGPVHVTGDGPHTVSAVTATGSDETTVLVDASPPTVDVATPADGAVFAQDQPATAAFACNDAGIGVDSCASNGPAFSTATIGVHTFTVAATDKLGKPTTRTVSYEVKPAVDAFVSSGTQGANGWYVTPPTITAQSPAGSAPPADAVTYTVNGASPQPYTGPFQVTAEGTSNLVFSAYGHTKPLTVKVDTTLPQITIATPPAGASYPRSAAVTASYACVETTPSAPAPSCSATVTPPSGPAVSVPSGSSLPTDLQGSYRMVVSSTDESGKTATLARSYTVGTPQPLTGIVFTRSNRIWTIGADGTGLRQLTGIPGLDPASFLDDQAARSPDGRKIVFARRPTASAPAQLWMIDPDGRNPVQLTSDGDNTAPAWSSDGTRIAFQSTRSGSNGIDIWSAAWNGGALSNLTDLTNADGDDVTPSWSPASGLNSGKIVFASSRRPHGQFEIYSMTTSGANQTRLTNDPRTDREPAWSPDGSKIAFSSDRAGGNGGFEIYVMGAPYGNNQARMTTLGGDDAAPFWFNPTRLLFSSTQIGPAPLGGLAFISPSGGAPTKLANTAPGDTNPG